jgi:hypothetical protein
MHPINIDSTTSSMDRSISIRHHLDPLSLFGRIAFLVFVRIGMRSEGGVETEQN